MEYFYSKYTGEELEERLDRIDDIPELLAEMLTGKNYTTPEDALCIVKKYVPTIYENIPIDNNTIYWANTNDGKVLKARIKSSDNTGDADDDNGGCLWEKKTDTNGKEYLYSKLPVVTSEGITMYADNGDLDIPSIYTGLPIDGKTLIRDEEGVLMINPNIDLGGASTWNELEGKPTWITTNKPKWDYNSDIYNTPDLSIYATYDYVDDTFIPIEGDTDVLGMKNFKKGLKIDGLPITKSQDDVIYLDANLVVRGGITMFGTNSVDVPTIMDAIATDNVNLKVVDGVLTFVGSSGGGLSEVYWDDVIGKPTLLSSFIDDVGYLQKSGGQMTGHIGYTLERDTTYTIGLPVSGSASFTEFYSFLQSSKTFIGSIMNSSSGDWFDLISLRHTNGHGGEGLKYGMYLITKLDEYNDLSWNKQINGVWQRERVILDSVNWKNYVTAISAASEYSYGLKVIDDRYDNPSQPTGQVSWHLKLNSAIGSPSGSMYVGLLELSSWTDWSAGNAHQLVFDGWSNIYWRTHNAGTMNPWYEIVHTGNINNLSVDVVGANFGVNNWSEGIIRGISLYGGADFVASYGICFATLSAGFGGHGSVNRDWATYFTMDGTADRGWIFRYVGSSTNVFSIACNGNVLANGGITMYSDIRKKTKLQDVELSLKQIADAPLIEHYYNSDAMRTTHVGSIAQYWAGLNDWFCKLDGDGYYTMEIQNAALASAISIARELVKYESKTDRKIRLLKQRVKELEDKIEKLENN